ncbi:MAG: glycosyltransferase [Hydrogenophilales bacterium]|nr:glycosyltransferase [Hydrogenophilales bacterium]
MNFDRIPLPWRARKALAWLAVNRNALSVLARAFFRPPKYRILISSAFFGGVGGVEKLLKTLIESMPDALFHVHAREVRTAGFVPRTRNFLLNWLPRRGSPLDLYVYFAGGGRPPYLGDDFAFRASIIDTCGADIRDIEEKFDWVAIQTGNASRYSGREDKWVLAFPSMRLTFPAAREPVDLPPRYFVTVFNPYSDKLKGGDAVFRAADHAAVPIVWCYSDKSGLKFDGLTDHPNVIQLKNLSQEALYYVYEHALAYISFSHSEGLGWSIAEAFYSGLPIISREVGFVTYIKDQPGVFVYRDEAELFDRVSRPDFEPPRYDYDYLGRNTFEQVFVRIIADASRGTT